MFNFLNDKFIINIYKTKQIEIKKFRYEKN